MAVGLHHSGHAIETRHLPAIARLHRGTAREHLSQREGVRSDRVCARVVRQELGEVAAQDGGA